MSSEDSVRRMAHIVLMGLEFATERELRGVLEALGHDVDFDGDAPLRAADVVFCGGDDPGYAARVGSILAFRKSLPVVVASRIPDTRKWLDALETGATDYCSTPFEAVQIAWVLSFALAHGKATAAREAGEFATV